MHLLIPAFAAFALASPNAPSPASPVTSIVQPAASIQPVPAAQPIPTVAQGQTAATAAPAYASRPRQTLEQRFQGANRSGDGHLTLDQASSVRWSYVTRNFDAIDQAHRGFVTIDDIRGYARERRAARQLQPRAGTTASSSG